MVSSNSPPPGHLEAAGSFTTALADALGDLADAQLRRGDPVAAAESFELAAETWHSTAGAVAPETFEARRMAAHALIEAEHLQQAEEILLELVDDLERTESRSTRVYNHLASSFSMLQQIFRQTGREAEAERKQTRRRELP